MPRVLISDDLSPRAVEIFGERGVDADVMTGLSPDELKKIIGRYDGLAVRSATKVTKALLEHADQPQGDRPRRHRRRQHRRRRGDAARHRRDEHALRQFHHHGRARDRADAARWRGRLPAADRSTQAGKWEKSRFMGVELTGKTLGVIGCGNVGSIVADRAIGLKMKVIAYDPFLSPERALALGVEKVELDELYARADFITLHTPLTDATRNIIDARALAKMKQGRAHHQLRARRPRRRGGSEGGARFSGQVAGAALDVFPVEPAKEQHPVRPRRRDRDAASRRLHHRGAGERGAADRRADVGFPASPARW